MGFEDTTPIQDLIEYKVTNGIGFYHDEIPMAANSDEERIINKINDLNSAVTVNELLLRCSYPDYVFRR